MTPSIRLIKLSVSGWKGIDEVPVEIDFGASSWLIHGANEAGKSSLFSALRFALFEYSHKGGAYSDGWVNNTCPEAHVEVELLISGTPYTISKVRHKNKNGSTTLWDGVGAEKRERSLNKKRDTDEEIFRLLGARPRVGRALETPARWGILAWLLAPQSIDTVADARTHATETLGLGRAISPQFRSTKAAIDRFVVDNYGKGESPLTGSDLRAADVEIAGLFAEDTEIERQRQQFDATLTDLAMKKAELDSLTADVKAREEEQDEGKFALVDFAADEQRLETMRAEIEGANAELRLAEAAVHGLTALDDELRDLATEITKAAREIGRFETKASRATTDATVARDAMNTLIADREAGGATIDNNRALIRSVQHSLRLTTVTAQVAKAERLQTEIKTLEDQGAIFDEATLDQRLQLAADFEQAESLLENLATARRVHVGVTGSLDATWQRDGLPTTFEQDLGFASELKIAHRDFTLAIHFDSQEDDIDWLKRRLQLRGQVQELGHADALALKTEALAERVRTRAHADAVRLLQELGDLAELTSERNKLADEILAEVPEWTAAVEVLQAEIDELTAAGKGSEKELQRLRDKQSALSEQAVALNGELQTAQAGIATLQERRQKVQTARDSKLAAGGDGVARTGVRDEITAKLKELRSQLAAAEDLLKTTKGTHSDALRAQIRLVRGAQRRERNCKMEIKIAEDKATELGGVGLQAKHIAVQQQLEAAVEKREVIARRHSAYRRLAKRISTFVTDATDIETGPVRERVQRWLSQVTNGHWRTVEMDSHLEVTRLEGLPPAIDGESMGSAGLRQVLHALTRLAVAVKIHEDGKEVDPNFPPVALVMDESQSHVDKDRVRRLMNVFNEQIEAGTVQVMALSHRRDEFQNLRAMNYDIERRESYDLDEE